MYPSERTHMELIGELAGKAFANHAIEVRLAQGLYRNWQCKRPGTGMHLFNVSTEPGRLFLTGDIECFVFARSEDMLSWLRGGCLEDLHYLASKVIAGKVWEWSADVAREWIEREERTLEEDLAEEEGEPRKAKLRAKLAKFRDLRGTAEYGEHVFSTELWQSGLADGGDWPRLETFTSGFLWCREALKWFVAHLGRG